MPITVIYHGESRTVHTVHDYRHVRPDNETVLTCYCQLQISYFFY
jgi:hypothetical protein